MRIYLDNCCYNRPFDDFSQEAVKLEAEAVLYIQTCIKRGKYDLVWSSMAEYENNHNPYKDRKKAALKMKEMAAVNCLLTKEIIESAKPLLNLGIKPKDAYHIACAVYAKCEYFITTDKKLLKTRFPDIKTINPFDFIKEQGL